MPENQDQINLLLEKLDELLKKQESFSREIDALSREVQYLKYGQPQPGPGDIPKKPVPESPLPPPLPPETLQYASEPAHQPPPLPKPASPAVPAQASPQPPPLAPRSNIEKFIGENLISKIGIAITVIGVAIGAKYAIDHDMISPLTRIILGYLVGLGLFAFAVRLKKNYENFSAVLLSGSMAILYFITFAAFSFYALIPQEMAFTLMALFTAFTVAAAVHYNNQVIAQIGLVGAYAVPFLLSEGKGQIAFLFSYIAIINTGILVIAFKRYWKSLYFSAFGLTWLIYAWWYAMEYIRDQHFSLALTFLPIFFAIFYVTFLAYKLLRKEQFNVGDILSLLLNSFFFYGFGYATLAEHPQGEELLGLFTLANAAVHFIVSAVIYRWRLADRSLFYLVSGLVLVFITLAFPVQLDGNWVTLFWAAEAALLFWIGRRNHVPVYEILSYPLMFLAFFSLAHDWATSYNSYYPEQPETWIKPFLNIRFLTGLLVAGAFFFIHWFDKIQDAEQGFHPLTPSPPLPPSPPWLRALMSIALPGMLLLALYFSGRVEIATWWDQLFADSALTLTPSGQDYPEYFRDYDLPRFKIVWILNYSLGFLAILSFVNMQWIKSRLLGVINLVVSALAMLTFLVQGLYELSELRESFLGNAYGEYYRRTGWNMNIRYVSFVFLAALLIACYQYIRQAFMQVRLKIAFDLLLHISALWVASSELIHWMDIADPGQSYKLGLSILWGVYALLLIVLGIWQHKKHLRIGAIILFGITLVKLFLYDLTHLDTIAKTVVFVSLGVLLLIISFLYNKYRNSIFDDDEN